LRNILTKTTISHNLQQVKSIVLNKLSD